MEDEACDFCRVRNISAPCIKKWGQKKEDRLSRPMPTTFDEIIHSQDVHLLQYAYSSRFGCIGGVCTSRLFKKLRFVFGNSLTHASLREAILSFSAAFLPSETSLERSEYHAKRACRVLMTGNRRSEEHTSELQSPMYLVCRL